MDSVWSGNNALNAKIEYERAYQALLAADIPKAALDGACLTQSYLRLEVQLNIATNTYPLNVLANVTNNGVAVRSTEVRLTQQDAFYCSAIQMTVAKPASLTSTAIVPVTYPSPITFSTSGAAAALYTLYNGYMSINVNNDIIVTRYPLMNFLQVPITQLTGATNTPIDQFSGADRFALQPNPVFIGQNTSIVTLHLPAALAVVETTEIVIVELYGVLAQNVTTLVTR